MGIDIIIKIFTLLAGAIGIAKIFYEIVIGRRTRMREEYKFAKEFFSELETTKRIHPFTKEKGYQAIAGDNEISSCEIEYLLSLQQPDLALRDYVLGRQYLQHLPQVGNREITFKKKFQNVWFRRILKTIYCVLYAILVFLTFAPLLFSKYLFKDSTKISATAIIMCFFVFAPYAWFALKAVTRIVRAEKLVKRQEKHTPTILQVT
uniref:Uncharacterized protein n=1 Tax=Geobacter sp. (strain M21) TaxID=443144 RepID=C6E142_GEOSM